MNIQRAFFLIPLIFFAFIPSAFAQCTPGIPCTSYQPGTDANSSKDNDENENTCDADVMNMIHARALLEAQRENMMNQIFVAKQDSVLEYSCFGEFAAAAAYNAPPIFSESQKWASGGPNATIDINAFESTCCPTRPPADYPTNRQIDVNMGIGHISGGLGPMIITPFNTYIGNNFGHSYLGGNQGYDPGVYSSSQPKASVDCARMQAIWFQAKCSNFTSIQEITAVTSEADPFMTFEEIIQNDPRSLIEQCSNDKITEDMVRIARNPAPEYPTFSNEFTETFPAAIVDGVRHPHKDIGTGLGKLRSSIVALYSDPKLKKPSGPAAPTGMCAQAVPTGAVITVVQITSDQTSTQREAFYFRDAVCPNPDCFYNMNMSSNLGRDRDDPNLPMGFCAPVTYGVQ